MISTVGGIGSDSLRVMVGPGLGFEEPDLVAEVRAAAAARRAERAEIVARAAARLDRA